MKSILSALFVLVVSTSFSQGGETISTDRPGASNTPFTVGKNSFQTENGLLVGQTRVGQFKFNYQTASTAMRFGIAKRTELGLRTGYSGMQRYVNNDPGFTRAGLDKLTLFGRQNFLKGNGWRPAIGLYLAGSFQIDPNVQVFDGAPQYQLLVMTYQTFGERFSLVTNFGTNYIREEISFFGEPRYRFSLAGTINLGYKVTDKLTLNIGTQEYDEFLGLGATYLLTNNLQLDLTGVFDPSFNGTYTTVLGAVGISWRKVGKEK